APIPPGLSDAALADIGSAIDALLAGDGTGDLPATSVYVVDADNGQEVYRREEDTLRVPASNTKLFTTATALALLGPDHRPGLTAWADAPVDPAGAVATLTVVSEHDLDWNTTLHDRPEVPAERLADLVVAAGVRSVGALVASGEYLVEGETGGVYDVGFHRDAAAVVLEDALTARGITVGAVSTDRSLDPPAGATLLASRPSAPLSVATWPTNVDSHNEQADLLCRHLGWALGAGSTYEAGTAVTLDWLPTIGVDATGLVLNDGSGVSRDNLVTARQVVALLAAGLDAPYGPAWEHTFSIPGVRGTLAGRLAGPTTLGRFRGKTGTHGGENVALGGILHHATDGHRYLVSILINELPAGDEDQVTDEARALADAIVEVIAADHRPDATRPATPAVRTASARGDGVGIDLRWDPVPDAEAYEVWTSADGAVWRRTDAREVVGATEVTVDWAPGAPDAPRYLRVVAVSGGEPSDPSVVFGASTAPGGILVIDGIDGASIEPENPTIGGHPWLVPQLAALAASGAPVRSASAAAVAAGDVVPADADLVVWALGEHGLPPDDALLDALSTALDAGTGLVVSGADAVANLRATADGEQFVTDRLNLTRVDGDAGETTAIPTPLGWFDGLGPELSSFDPGSELVDDPDVLAPEPGGFPVLAYRDGGGDAAIGFDDGVARGV
ncbi:MAG: D-alanyl-D-alanine carboxypeptidase, partial [Myxococcota bacterium]